MKCTKLSVTEKVRDPRTRVLRSKCMASFDLPEHLSWAFHLIRCRS